MLRRTTTKRINDAITNGLLHIEKAEVYNKTSRKTETIDADRFKENFDFLCESSCFTDVIGWHYEQDCKSNGYICECGRRNPYSENIVTVYLSTGDDVNGEDVNKVLLEMEE